MTYQGSKHRIADGVTSILKRIRKPGQFYWEPFLGSASTFILMDGPKLGTDVMADLILLWKEVMNDSFCEPTSLTKKEYDVLMKQKTPSALRAYAGFFWSFSGMFNKGYSEEAYRRSRSFHEFREMAKILSKQKLTMLSTCDYRTPDIIEALIYCDPPYKNTTPYRGTPPFNHEDFYKWCLEQKEKGNTVIVSEYEMPEPFTLIQEFEHRTPLGVVHREQYVNEKLFALL